MGSRPIAEHRPALIRHDSKGNVVPTMRRGKDDWLDQHHGSECSRLEDLCPGDCSATTRVTNADDARRLPNHFQNVARDKIPLVGVVADTAITMPTLVHRHPSKRIDTLGNGTSNWLPQLLTEAVCMNEQHIDGSDAP